MDVILYPQSVTFFSGSMTDIYTYLSKYKLRTLNSASFWEQG